MELVPTAPLEVVQPTAIESLTKAEVDMQIATARKWPRQLSLVKQRMLSFATLDQETASGCFYTLPARKGGDGKPLQGPSVRLAEIAINSFQHIRAGSRVINDDGKFITAQGVVHDLENNVCVSIEVKRRVTNKDGHRYSDDMIATTGNAACSIALRNAAFRVIPLALVKPVYEAAKRLAIGDGKSLVQRRSACLEHFAKMGVTADRVCAAVGVRSPEDITLEHLETLIGFATAIKDGDTTVDEVFTTQAPPAPTDTAAPKLAGKRAPKTEAAPQQPAPEPQTTAASEPETPSNYSTTPEPEPQPEPQPAPEPDPMPTPEPEPPAALPLMVQQLRHVVEEECKADFGLMVSAFRNLRWHPTLVPKLKSWADMPERTAAGVLGDRTKAALVAAIGAIQKGISPA